MTPLEGEKDVEKVKQQAIAFYDQEHDLNQKDRQQLYIFFEQQCRRMLLGFSVGVAIGAAAPFIVRKKGSLVHPAFPVIGAVLGGTIVPGLVNNTIFTLQIDQFRRKFGEESSICKTIAKTPDPISKSVFWSAYFKKSSEDPNFRMKDPRTVVNSNKFFSLEDNPTIPPYGRPGYYKSNESDSPPTLNEQYLTGWDKVRSQKVSNTQPTTSNSQYNFNSQDNIQSQSTPQPDGDIFEISNSSSYQTQKSIGDSYDSNDDPIPTSNQKAFQIDNDQMIQQQGANGNAWDRVRQSSKRD